MKGWMRIGLAAASLTGLAGCGQGADREQAAGADATPSAVASQQAGDTVVDTREVDTEFGAVRIEQITKEGAAHVEPGRISVSYLKDGKPDKTFPKAVELGSFGALSGFRVYNEFGALPVIVSKGGGTWQGNSCEWTVLTELRPDGPVEVANFESAFDNSGAKPDAPTAITGEIGAINADNSFTVDFTGSRSFSALYLRQPDGTYQVQGGKEQQLSGC
ncbi:hypothetical protein B2G71_16650 [Novosphingobium sp. PC22D]|uniref:hypothetical protein n=1 Tax=Novosphingobium sp. PC22D TaxID=1962403 RepID=UPI000BEF94F8|nr:hypothetical protein [Novosphingobium sp. PC22D]PEQ11461.1 hypothetical protein B2G71_16650 [Novosphingobium sp. PC22D]